VSTLKNLSQPMSAGLVVAIVGFFSSFPIVLQGIKSIGANEVQAASGLMMASVAMGVAGIGLSLWKKMPISVAWSTPGVALLAVTLPIEDGFAGAVAGFIIAGGLTVLAGLWRPLGKLATSVPAPLAQAMLAGVLVSLCIAPFKAMAEVPMTAIPVVVTWFVVGRFNKLFAVPAAVIAALIITGFATDFSIPLPEKSFALPEFTTPVFSLSAFLSIGLPLFIVTMATQNIPGIAILKANG
jgi:benzoate membrane transport protein